MTRKLTDQSKTLYRYENKVIAELIVERGYLLPGEGDCYLVFSLLGHEKPIRRIDDAVDINGNQCRNSETPCIFLTQSYPYYERNIGQLWVSDYVFPIKVPEILDQGFSIYQSPRGGCGNVWVIPDPDLKPLYIDVSKAKRLDWKWYLYAGGLASFVSPIQRVHRAIKKI